MVAQCKTKSRKQGKIIRVLLGRSSNAVMQICLLEK